MSPYLQLFRRYLREQGLPVTPQREAVADAIFSSSGHLSVEDIETALRGTGERIGKATIYRTMEILVRSGLVEEHDFGEGFKRYEHVSGPTPVQEEMARRHGFVPTRHRLEIYGLCPECQEKGVQLPDEGLTCPVELLN